MSNHKFNGHTWNLDQTQAGKPKIVDGNGFCICTAPDATKESDKNFKAIAMLPDMLEAMQEFCDRVDRGEVRSKYTYAKFKTIIQNAEN